MMTISELLEQSVRGTLALGLVWMLNRWLAIRSGAGLALVQSVRLVGC
jgi:hypothetical protein